MVRRRRQVVPYHSPVAVVAWLDEHEQAAWRGFVAVTHRVSAAIARDLQRDHGLSEPEYAVLVALSEAEGATLRMGELAAGLEWSRSRLSHMLSRMEQRGLITKVDCPSDARGAFAALTDAGLAEITAAAPAHVASVRRHFLDHLDRQQLEAVASITAALLASSPGCPSGCDASDGVEGC